LFGNGSLVERTGFRREQAGSFSLEDYLFRTEFIPSFVPI